MDLLSRGDTSSSSCGVCVFCWVLRRRVHVPKQGLGPAGVAMLFVSAGNSGSSEVVTAELMKARRARSTKALLNDI